MKTYKDVRELKDKALSQMEEILKKPELEISQTDFATLMRSALVISNINDILFREYLKGNK